MTSRFILRKSFHVFMCRAWCFLVLGGVFLPPFAPMIEQKLKGRYRDQNNDENTVESIRRSTITINGFLTVHSLFSLMFVLLMRYSNKLLVNCYYKFPSIVMRIIMCIMPLVLAYIWPCFMVGDIDDDMAVSINTQLQQRLFSVNAFALFVAAALPDGDDCPTFGRVCIVLTVSACWSSFMGQCWPWKSRERWTFSRFCRVYSGSCFVVTMTLLFCFLRSLRGAESYKDFCFSYVFKLLHTNSAIFNLLLWGLSSIIFILMPILLYISPLNSPLHTEA